MEPKAFLPTVGTSVLTLDQNRKCLEGRVEHAWEEPFNGPTAILAFEPGRYPGGPTKSTALKFSPTLKLGFWSPYGATR